MLILSIETLLIACTSRAIIEDIQKWLKEIGVGNKTYTAVSHDELLDKLCNHKPAYLLIEGSFFRESTVQEISRIVKEYSKTIIIVFGFYEYTEKFLKMLFKVGIRAYLNMRMGQETFKEELRLVLEKNKVIPPHFEKTSRGYYHSDSTKLTRRDLEIINLILEGFDNNKIAEKLHIKQQTVKNHRENIYYKLRVTNVVGMMKKLMREGIISEQLSVSSEQTII